jgi:hypothetical protein
MDILPPKTFFVNFPRLKPDTVNVTSPEDLSYNCIAWASGSNSRWWWPGPDGFWPPGAPEDETLDAFVKAFQTLGYEIDVLADYEEGKDKIALYAKSDSPTHAARQLPNGKWTSKCGRSVDIEHLLHELEGHLYGEVVIILSRLRLSESK